MTEFTINWSPYKARRTWIKGFYGKFDRFTIVVFAGKALKNYESIIRYANDNLY
jgi:hypothetical protein